MKRLIIITLTILIWIALPTNVFGQKDVRTSRASITAHWTSGKISDDPAAILSAEVDYALLNRLSLGINYSYIDGHLIQKHTIGLFAKGYALDWIIDIYGGGGINFHTNESNQPAIIPHLRAGVEWQAPFRIVLGLEGVYLMQPGHQGLLKGGFIGFRF